MLRISDEGARAQTDHARRGCGRRPGRAAHGAGPLSGSAPEPVRARAGPDPPATSYDHSSEPTDTGPPCGDGLSAPAWPCANAGEATHFWNDSSSRHRVTTSHWRRSSVGRSSSKPSKPSWSSTACARAAKRLASSSPASSGTVMALILITVCLHQQPWHLTSGLGDRALIFSGQPRTHQGFPIPMHSDHLQPGCRSRSGPLHAGFGALRRHAGGNPDGCLLGANGA